MSQSKAKPVMSKHMIKCGETVIDRRDILEYSDVSDARPFRCVHVMVSLKGDDAHQFLTQVKAGAGQKKSV